MSHERRSRLRSGEAGQAPRAVKQLRPRAALDDPVADLGEPFRVREACKQPRQPLARFGPEPPGRQTAQQRPFFGTAALEAALQTWFEALFTSLFPTLLKSPFEALLTSLSKPLFGPLHTGPMRAAAPGVCRAARP